MMKKSCVMAAGLLAILVAGPASAQTAETKTTLEKLPPAVQEAIKAQAEGGKLLHVAKETKDSVTLYEAEMTFGGRRKDVLFDEQGKVVTAEEQKTLAEIPAGARASIQKAVGAGKLVLVEKVTKGDSTFYEGHISSGGKISEVMVDADGKPVE